jgi:NADH pyrophosphatase NudC (nudix superfamily)
MNNFFPAALWQFCPYCGEKAFRAGVENFMQCEKCLNKFYINASGAVACIIENAQDEILLTRRAFEPAMGMLDLPGGFVNIDETAEDAVRREIKEELNLEIAAMQYIGSSHNHYPYGGMMYFTLDLGFKCSVTDFTGMQVADDVVEYLFLQPDKINMQEICFHSIKNILQLYLTK